MHYHVAVYFEPIRIVYFDWNQNIEHVHRHRLTCA